jgi:membrane protease YdiL (CAAX protease family)
MADTTDRTPETPRLSYWRESRTFALSIISILPLIVMYHYGIIRSGAGVRNLAEMWLEGPLHLLGLGAANVLNIALLAALLAALWTRRGPLSFSLLVLGLMVVEAGVYAALLYRGGAAVTQALHERADGIFFSLDAVDSGRLMLALGAGVYEELIFRFVLLGGLALVLRKVFLWDMRWSCAAALIVSSLLFAAAHHIGPMGDELTSYRFLFRTVCGFALGAVFLARGLGVTVWTHALYNGIVALAQAGATS